MELGIKGRWAIVCASSQGLGKGCADALAGEGVNLVLNARGQDRLQQTAEQIQARFPTIEVRLVVEDVVQPDVCKALLGVAPLLDILINNAAGPPPGDCRDGDRDDWLKA